MATELRLRRGTTAQNAAFTGAMAEVTVDTQTKSLVVHDGVTPGGHRQATPVEIAAALAGKQDALGFTPENAANKGAPSGYAPLGADSKVPLAHLPTISAGEEVITPTNVAPANGATGQFDRPTFQASAFYSQYSQTHTATQLQISVNSTFSTTVYDSGDGAPSTTPVIPAGVLSVSTTYYWRVRYKNSRGIYSGWSNATTFTTAALFNSYIPTPAATPAIGAAFEGGFYTGMVWNEIAQSSSSVTIGAASGQRTFTVPDMAVTPLVYAGQVIEVRSRANPANKIVGTVDGAVGTSLTLTVTSVGGSGTFTDWSVMSRFRLIVAPKSVGESTTRPMRNSETAPMPIGSRTLSEGKRATAAMLADGNSTVYPLAYWAAGLSIGGKTDWYVPARDELELAWRNLKPVTNSNVTLADKPASAFNYAIDGSYADSGNVYGVNNNSAPVGGGYSSSDPARTSVTAFQSGGTEAFAFADGNNYLSSTAYANDRIWFQGYITSYPGYQFSMLSSTVGLCRAFRRSII